MAIINLHGTLIAAMHRIDNLFDAFTKDKS